MKCRWCKQEVPEDKYLEHLSKCKKYRAWLEKKKNGYRRNRRLYVKLAIPR